MSEHAESAADFTFDTVASAADAQPPSEALVVADQSLASGGLRGTDSADLAQSPAFTATAAPLPVLGSSEQSVIDLSGDTPISAVTA